MNQEKWENLNISRDEVKNIAAALKNDEFRSLLIDYVKETQSADARAKYQQEIVQLEAERGVDCVFVNPLPGFVVKTSQNGTLKAFLNICSNDLIAKPTSSPTVTEKNRGLNWSIPYSQAPPRDDFDRKNIRCVVYDVIFHPDTLYLSQNNAQFRNMVVDTALKGVEDTYKVKLDQTNIKFPKLKYKGAPQPTVIRKKSKTPVVMTEEDRDMHEKLNLPKLSHVEAKPMVKTMKNEPIQEFTAPTYEIKYRNDIDIQEFTFDKNCKVNAATPKELVVDIHLPLLNSTKTVDLDVKGKELRMVCEKPVKYKLEIVLPYAVTENGTAKFDLDKRVLRMILPVVRKTTEEYRKESQVSEKQQLVEVHREDSGVESDASENFLHESEETFPETPTKLDKVVESFLESDQHYQMPSYDIQRSGNILIFTLWVKNVDPESIKLKKFTNGFQAKFVSIGSGHFPIHYAFTGKFASNLTQEVVPDTFENSVILEVSLADSEENTFWVGLNEEELSSKSMADYPEEVFEKPAVERGGSPDANSCEGDDLSGGEDSVEDTLPEVRSPKARTLSEGSSDETAVRRSILKNRMNRSLSESCADEGGLSGGVLYTWSESCLSLRDSEGETREKKTVRFSQNIHCQTFRANSSILGQRRKNQKRSRNKRKSLERRLSESENSEEGDEREKWIKRRSKKPETDTVLKPVIKPKEEKNASERKNSTDSEGNEKKPAGGAKRKNKPKKEDLIVKSQLITDLD